MLILEICEARFAKEEGRKTKFLINSDPYKFSARSSVNSTFQSSPRETFLVFAQSVRPGAAPCRFGCEMQPHHPLDDAPNGMLRRKTEIQYEDT